MWNDRWNMAETKPFDKENVNTILNKIGKVENEIAQLRAKSGIDASFNVVVVYPHTLESLQATTTQALEPASLRTRYLLFIGTSDNNHREAREFVKKNLKDFGIQSMLSFRNLSGDEAVTFSNAVGNATQK
jgi:hypothetical protein